MMSQEGDEKGEKSSPDFAVDTKMDTNISAAGDSALARVIAAWPKLPEPIRRAIEALIDASSD
jgi:hypothetical protein